MSTPLPTELPVFQPTSPSLSGPAFGRSFKWLLLALMSGLTVWGIRVGWTLFEGTTVDREMVAWGLAGYALVVYMGTIMIRSRTTLTAQSLTQTWFWQKSTRLESVTYARFFRIRGWEWLFAPRLALRSGPGPFVVYHAASPVMWTEFERWADMYTQRR